MQQLVFNWREQRLRVLRTVVIVIAVTALTFGLRWALNPYISNAGLMGFPFAVMVSAWFGGFYAGLLATLLGFVFALIFYTAPSFSLELLQLKELIFLFSAVTQGIVISFLAKRAEASQREAKLALQQAEQANQAKSQFLANMSHEIRTPLGVMLGFSELTQECLRHESQTSIVEATQHLNSIQRNGRQLMHLINELLDLSKVEADRIEIERSLFSPNDLFDELQEMFQPRASRKNLQFHFDIRTPVPEWVVTDSFRMKQILMNLLSNAIKFTDQGSVRVEVDFELINEMAGSFNVRVSDSGIGVSPEQTTRLFQPFAQAESSTTRRFGGTGLGLALSLRLAHLLEGDLKLEASSVGHGSTFVLKIPVTIEVKRSHRVNAATPAIQENIEDTPSIEVDPKTRLEGLSVLLVEDSADNQVVISRFIRGAGGQVSFANDGIEGLEKLEREKFDVVLMDIQMPRMNGHDATIEIRKRGNQVPIIALTAYALPEERNRCLQAGCDDHLTKPIDRPALIETLARYLKTDQRRNGANASRWSAFHQSPSNTEDSSSAPV